MNGTARLSCLIYSHGWCLPLLENTPLKPARDRTLWVELALDSHLAPLFQQHGLPRPGLAPLLAPPSGRGWFGRRSSPSAPARLEETLKPALQRLTGLPVPLVLAANPPLSRAALDSALALLNDLPSEFGEIVLLTHVADAPELENCYRHAERITVLWDVADPPSAALPRMAEVLARQHAITPERWGGFHLCHHPARITPDLEARRADWSALLAEFPALDGVDEAA